MVTVLLSPLPQPRTSLRWLIVSMLIFVTKTCWREVQFREGHKPPVQEFNLVRWVPPQVFGSPVSHLALPPPAGAPSKAAPDGGREASFMSPDEEGQWTTEYLLRHSTNWVKHQTSGSGPSLGETQSVRCIMEVHQEGIEEQIRRGYRGMWWLLSSTFVSAKSSAHQNH